MPDTTAGTKSLGEKAKGDVDDSRHNCIDGNNAGQGNSSFCWPGEYCDAEGNCSKPTDEQGEPSPFRG